MSLASGQALVNVVVKGTDLQSAPELVREALEPYPNARIVTMTQKSNWVTSWSGAASLLLVIEYSPDGESGS